MPAPSSPESLVAGGQELGRVYAAPGHAPDHVLLRVGPTLFVGDLFHTLEPGVAGAAGFDRDALGRTFRGLDLLLADGDVETVCSGHETTISAEEAAAMLRELVARLPALPPIAPLSAERMVATRVVAFELLEADRLFALIGGRLLALARHLAALGEEEAADAIEVDLQDDPVEPCLASFIRFADEYLAGWRHDGSTRRSP